MCQNGIFFPISGAFKMEEGNALRDAYERPGFRPKRTPLGFLMFFRAEVGGSAAGVRASP